jgi:hypothetical protein
MAHDPVVGVSVRVSSGKLEDQTQLSTRDTLPPGEAMEHALEIVVQHDELHVTGGDQAEDQEPGPLHVERARRCVDVARWETLGKADVHVVSGAVRDVQRQPAAATLADVVDPDRWRVREQRSVGRQDLMEAVDQDPGSPGPTAAEHSPARSAPQLHEIQAWLPEQEASSLRSDGGQDNSGSSRPFGALRVPRNFAPATALVCAGCGGKRPAGRDNEQYERQSAGETTSHASFS